MINSAEEGVYTKTQAFNFLKDLLEVPHNVLISKKFFSLFFEDSDSFFVIKQPESKIESIFENLKIPERNRNYFEVKMAKKTEEAKKIEEKVIQDVEELLVA